MPAPEKFILDATASFRRMWLNKHHPNAIYLDQRKECEPDVIGDFRDLSRFQDKTFRLVVFDPPHETSKSVGNPNAPMNRDFGWLEFETWPTDLKKGFEECWRVLKDWGVLVFKWNDKRIKHKEVLALFHTKPLFGQISKGNMKGQSNTFWFCFLKIPEQETKRNAAL